MKRNFRGLLKLSELTKAADRDMFGRPLPNGVGYVALLPVLRFRDRVGADFSRSGRQVSDHVQPSEHAPAPHKRKRSKGHVRSNNWTVTPHPPAPDKPSTTTTPAPSPTPPPSKSKDGSGGGESGVVEGIKNTTQALRSFAGLLRALNGE